MEPLLSVVIPTFNRLDVLPEVLDAVEAQEGAPPFELVVVDDGSSDGTAAWLDARAFRLPAQVLHQTNAGPARARNRGVAVARGRWVAFLGDDTVPSTGWLAAHHHAHESRGGGEELAVIGYTRWHRRMRVDAFLDYINEYGLQFGYALIEDRENVPFNFFYTSNLSLHRSRLLAEPFDERFPYAAWEDIETSYRLSKGGQRMIYEPAAEVEHDHPTDLARFASRQEKAGYSAVLFYRLHPELGGFLGLGPGGPPPELSPTAQTIRGTLARTLQKLSFRTPKLWEEWLRGEYIRGLHRGWRDGLGGPPAGHEFAGSRESSKGDLK
ncbi:MAG: glycosyltransferase family 2 protein [Acidobacteria bacterium]|nr:glycosyltransferase family 2 protein [Acidobacteriota bacterium]